MTGTKVRTFLYSLEGHGTLAPSDRPNLQDLQVSHARGLGFATGLHHVEFGEFSYIEDPVKILKMHM